MPAPVAAKVALAVLRTRRGRRLFLALVGGLLLGLAMVVIVLLGSVGAVVGECRTQAAEGAPVGPSGTPSPTYVSQEPSEAALADIPANYLALYRKAAEDYGLDWAILAAIGKIETDHGRLDAPGVTSGENFAGAGGPMQFLASTWASVGVDGNGDGVKDRYDPEDAIPSAANYLKLEGAPQDYRSALFAYNNAQWYVDDVLARAGEYRAAAGRRGGGMASDARRPALASLLSPLGSRPAYAAEAGTEGGAGGSTVGDPGETSYSSPELEVLDLVNGYREENGLEPLLLSDELSASGARYAHDMAKYDAYGEPEAHVSGPSDYYPEGADLTARMNAEGYFASRYGENIAAGQETARGVFEAWRTSPPHDEMMLDPGMRAVGIGLVENPETSYEEFWVTNFGSDEDGTARPVSGAAPVAADGSRVRGEAKAVFPLPKEWYGSYSDDWGAARPNGGHEGTDLMAPRGTAEYAITDGTVVEVAGADSQGWNELGGWAIMIEADYSIGPIQKGDLFYYAHRNKPELKPGDRVKAGQKVGESGSSGYGPVGTTGRMPEHLHFGWYDPTMRRAEAASGAMNPYPLLEWLRQNGGTATGDAAAPVAPGFAPGALAPSLPGYCDPFVEVGLVSRPSGAPAGTPVDSPGGGSDSASPTRMGSGSAQELLADPNFEASPEAAADLKNGVVDEGLVSAIQAITARHRIRVSVFKSGHPYGANLPAGLGGGYNSHYYGRAVDIPEVDGKPVAGNGTDPDVLDVGRILRSLSAGARPDEVAGPTDWTAELGYAREEGFITDPGFTASHYDHVHVGRGAP